MADGITPNRNFVLPEVGLSKGTWGTKLNQNWEDLDDLLSNTTGAFLSKQLTKTQSQSANGRLNIYADGAASGISMFIYGQGDASVARFNDDGTTQFFGLMTLPAANPTSANHAARKGYVDTKLPRNGSSGMTGNLSMGGNRITSLAAPTANNDAARKQDVDAMAPQTRTISTGAGLNGGGNLSANRTLSVDTSWLDNRTDGRYVPLARTITAGTGLTGGGSLSANRTLNVSYGTTAGTAAQGNDSRIVNAVPDTRTITAGAGLTGGGTLADNRTVAMGTPSSITRTSTNNASGATHTHNLPQGAFRDMMANYTAAGSMGAYVLAREVSGPGASFGGTAPGSRLYPISTGGDLSPDSLSGTWRCMGYAPEGGDPTTLWMRIE